MSEVVFVPLRPSASPSANVAVAAHSYGKPTMLEPPCGPKQLEMILQGGLTLQRHLHCRVADWITIVLGWGSIWDEEANFYFCFFVQYRTVVISDSTLYAKPAIATTAIQFATRTIIAAFFFFSLHFLFNKCTTIIQKYKFIKNGDRLEK